MRAYEQVLSISNDALEIADTVPTDVTDFAKATFWEQMVEAASNEARVEDIERYGTMAVDHYRASGDERSTWRAMNKLALALSNNHRPDRAIEILRTLVEDSPDLAADPELARAATIYSRALMLSGGKGVRRMTDTALNATEKLQLVPEIVDGLITKATVLGNLGRIVESRILLEGAIGIAEPRELSEAIGRAKNNLGYVMIGIDNPAGIRIGESLYQDAKRLGNRSQVLFQGVSRVSVLQYQGRFEDAEEILTDPLFDDPPAAIRAQQLALTGQVARWRGNHEEADVLKAEALEVAKGVDDPQALANLHVLHMDTAMQNDLDKVIELGLSEMSQDWFRALVSLELTLMAIGLSKDLDQLDVWIETMRPYLPRFEREVRFAEALIRQARGVDSVEEIDALIDEIEEEGWLILVIQRRISAAAFLPEDKAAEYLEEVRDTCSERGWNWYPELVDRYLA
jgi:tetratricopeptide (TPR) repeat protein